MEIWRYDLNQLEHYLFNHNVWIFFNVIVFDYIANVCLSMFYWLQFFFLLCLNMFEASMQCSNMRFLLWFCVLFIFGFIFWFMFKSAVINFSAKNFLKNVLQDKKIFFYENCVWLWFLMICTIKKHFVGSNMF